MVDSGELASKRRWAAVKERSAREAEARVALDTRHAFHNTLPGSNYGAHDKSRMATIFFQVRARVRARVRVRVRVRVRSSV